MNFALALLMNAASTVTPGSTVQTPPTAPPIVQAEDCDGSSKPKTAEVLTADPKAADQKAIEDKALQKLGLKKDEVKKPENVVSGVSGTMETCK